MRISDRDGDVARRLLPACSAVDWGREYPLKKGRNSWWTHLAVSHDFAQHEKNQNGKIASAERAIPRTPGLCEYSSASSSSGMKNAKNPCISSSATRKSLVLGRRPRRGLGFSAEVLKDAGWANRPSHRISPQSLQSFAEPERDAPASALGGPSRCG